MSDNKERIVEIINSNIITEDKEFNGYFDHNTVKYINDQLKELSKLAKTL